MIFYHQGDMLIEHNNNINIEGCDWNISLDRSWIWFFGKSSKQTNRFHLYWRPRSPAIPSTWKTKVCRANLGTDLKDIPNHSKIPEAKRIDVTGGISVKEQLWSTTAFLMSIEDIDFASTSEN